MTIQFKKRALGVLKNDFERECSGSAYELPDLIIADSTVADIRELMQGAVAPLVSLRAGHDPITQITHALSGIEVGTLHLVAHGHPGMVALAGQWLDIAALRNAAAQLTTWSVHRIALWVCHGSSDPRLPAELARLTGAAVYASDQALGWVEGQLQWELSLSVASGASHSVAPLNPILPVEAARLSGWRAQLGTMKFTNAYAVNTATTSADREQNSIDFNTTSLGVAIINDSQNGENFSGTDVAVKLTVNGNDYYGWISRPIKSQGKVKGFYFWTDSSFTDLNAATTDGNKDGDGSSSDNSGFVLVVDQSYFDGLSANGNLKTVGSSSDRVDSNLNSVKPVATAPVAVNDSATFLEDTSNQTGNVLSNDSDQNGDTLSISSFKVDGSSGTVGSAYSISGVGSFTLNSNGSYSFTPVANYSGPVPAISYVVSDGNLTSTGNLSITVTEVNDAPSGADKTINSGENQDYTFTASDFGFTDSNDSPANKLDAVIIKTLPGAGTLKLNGSNVSADQVISAADISKLTFTPASNANGNSYASFTFQVRDDGGTSNSGVNIDQSANTITFNISNVNNAPTAVADTATAVEAGGASNATSGTNPTGNVLTNDTDIDSSDGKTVSSAKSAQVGDTSVASNTSITGTYGTLVISSDGSYTYTVDNSNTAVQALRTSSNTLTDTFNYTMKDTAGLKSSSTLTITVQGANDNPVGVDDSATAKESIASSGNYDSADTTGYKATGNVLNNDTDVDANGETKTVAGLSGSANANVVADENVATKLTFNAASTLSPVGAGDEIFILKNGTYRALYTSDGTQITVTSNTALGGDQYDIALSGTPAKYYDAGGNIAISSLNSETVGFRNDDGASTTSTGGLKTATVSSSSATGNSTATLTSISGSLAAGMSVSGTGVPSDTKISSISYDGSGNPTLTFDKVITTTTGQAFTFTASAGTTLTGRYGSLVLNSDGSYTYTPKSNNADLSEGGSGTESFTYKVKDASNAEDSAVLNIKVLGSGTNDPDANADTATAVEAGTSAGTNPTGNVLTNDTTPSGTGTLSVTHAAKNGSSETALSGATDITGLYGTLNINTDGSYTYTVNNSNNTVNALRTSSDTLTDTFTYRVKNSTAAKESVATLTVTIQGANDAPTATADTASAYEAGGVGNGTSGSNPAGNLLTNDSDVDTGDGKSVSAFSTSGGSNGTLGSALTGTYGTLTVSSDGSYTYNVDNSNSTVQALGSGQTVTETFNYTLADTADATSSSTLTVTVNGANDAPVNTLPGSSPSVSEGGSVSISGVSVADSDSSSLTVTLTVQNGTLSVTQNGGSANISNSGTATVTITGSPSAITTALGSLSYTGGADFNGTDTLKVVSDDGALKDTDALDITVNADNRAVTVTGTTVNEASPYAMFKVTGAASQKVSLALGSTASTSDVDATSGTDFQPAMQYYNGSSWVSYSGGLVSIPSSGTTLLVRVPVLNDSSDEDDETFTLTATNKAGSANTGTSTIVDTGDGAVYLASNTSFTANSSGDTGYPSVLDDDRALTIANISVNENSSHAVFKVQGASGQVVTLSQVNGSATSGTDYGNSLEVWDGNSWSAYSSSATIPSGGNLFVRNTITDDNTYEGPENYGLKAVNGGGVPYTGTATIFDDGTGLVYDGTITGSAATTSSSNLDNDLSVAVTSSSPVNEGSTYAMFEVTATAGAAFTLATAGSGSAQATTSGFSYAFSADNGATWTTYSANSTPVTPGTLGSGTGKVQVRVNVSSEQDTTYEGSETFKLTATLSAGGATPLSAAAQTTIIDDGTGLKYDGTLSSGTPVSSNSGLDNDKPTVSVSDVTVSEASPYAVFNVSLSNASNAAVSFTPSLSSGTATVGTDTGSSIEYYNGSSWTAASGGVTIASGSTSVPVRVAISNDSVLENSENFTLSTGAITGTVSNSGAATGTGTIKDDGSSSNVFLATNTTTTPTSGTADNDKPTVSINSVTVSEASPYAVFKVSLSNASAAAISFTPSLANGTATIGTDTGSSIEYYNGSNWVSASSGVTIAAGSTSVLLRAAITNDTTLENSETFTISTGTITGTVTNSGAATGTGTIKDDGSSSNVFLANNTTETPTSGTADNDNVSYGLVLTGTSLNTSETGTTASFTVKLASQPTADVTVTLTGLDTSEGSLDKTTLTFTSSNWNTAQTVTVTGVNDTLDDGDINYTVTATSSSSGDANYNGANARTGTVSITNADDDAAPTLSINDVTVNENAGTASFTVTRSGATGGTTTVDYATANGTANSGSDYTAKSGSLSFAAGETSKTIAVDVTDDSLAESSETFTVGLSNIADASSSAESISDNSGTATITDNDASGLVLTGTSLNTSETGTTASFTVKLASQPTADVTVTLTGLDSSEGSLDKTALTFTSSNWNTAQTVTVTGVDDDLNDGAIQYTLTATTSSTDGSYSGSNAKTGTVAVTNADDDGAPAISIGDVSANEADGSLSFTVTRSGSTGGTTSVDYTTVNGTALAGADYTAASGSLSFAPGETSKTVTISIADDSIKEVSEDFTLKLSNASDNSAQAVSISTDTGKATIADNDNAGVVLSSSSLETSENGASGEFTLRLSSQPTADVVVTITGLDGTEGKLSTTSLTFTASNWNTPQKVTITGLGDDLTDGDISYTLNLSGSSSDTNYGGGNAYSGTVEVKNKDIGSPPSLSVSDASVNEDAGTAEITVSRSGASNGTTSVNYSTSDGGASAGSDYNSVSGSISFAPGETSKTISISIIDDALAENEENFTLTLSGATDSNRSVTLSDGEAVVSITDNDAAPSLSIAGSSVDENAGSAELTVSRSGSTAGTTTVNYASSDGSAVAGLDYTAVNGSLSFGPGETSKTITVPITDDRLQESSEAFSVSLSNAVDSGKAAVSLDSSSADVTINDDDKNVSLSISGTSLSESGGSAMLTVSRSGDLSSTTTVDYQTGDGSALSGTDYTAQSGQLVFAPGESSRTIRVRVIDDKVQEAAESFRVTLSGATDGSGKAVSVTSASADVAINDDDFAGLVVSAEELITSESGDRASFAVSLSSKPTASVSISINGLDVTEGALDQSVLTFTPDNWNAAQTVTVSGVSDSLVDGDIRYQLNLGSDSGDANYASGSVAVQSVTVTNKDALNQFVTGIVGDRVEEGGELNYQVTLNAASATEQFHSPSFAGDAIEADYLAPSFSDGVSFDPSTGMLTVPAGVSGFTVTVPTFDDRKVEDQETLVLQIGNRQADGLIDDNDVRPAAPVIVDVTETPTDPTPEDLLTGDTSQVIRVNGASGHSIRLYTIDGTLIPENDYVVSEIAEGVYEIDASGIDLAAGDYVARQVDRDGNESFDSNDFTVDSTPEVQDNVRARALLPESGMSGRLAVIDQNRVDLTDKQSTNPPELWYDSDGERAVFGIAGVTPVDGFARQVSPTGSEFVLNTVDGSYTYVPSLDAVSDVFPITVRDPGGKGGNLNLTFEVRDLLDRDGVPGDTEDQLAERLTGGSRDLNNDGIDDSTQNAVSTLAWNKQQNFKAAVSGQFDQVDPGSIISIIAHEDATSPLSSAIAQLIGIDVLSNSDGSLSQAGLGPYVSPWDPLQFSVEPLQSLGLIDTDEGRPGLQMRVTIDIAASEVRDGGFDDYMKYISADTIQAAIEAGVELVAPSGETLLSSSQAGWYSFMQTEPGGDGARYIIEDGYITSIELILTDNAFGDVDFTPGRITDPGMPVAFPDFTPPVITINEQVIEYLYQIVPENSREVVQLHSDEPVLWEIVDGDDQNHFQLDREGKLSFVTAPDFEAPTDSDVGNDYQLTISALDAAGNETLIVTTVEVQNVPEAKPVFAAPLAENDHWLSGLLDDAYAHSINDAGVRIEFYSLPEQETGTLPLRAWVNTITGDYFYAAQGTQPPYACYVPAPEVELGFVPAPGQGAFDVHLFMDDRGITQIVGMEQALAMQLSQSGYRDYGPLFASPEELGNNSLELIGISPESGTTSI